MAFVFGGSIGVLCAISYGLLGCKESHGKWLCFIPVLATSYFWYFFQ